MKKIKLLTALLSLVLIAGCSSSPTSTTAKTSYSSPSGTAVSSSTPKTTVTPAPPTPTPTPKPSRTTYKGGQYKVGVDIPAGEYFILVQSTKSSGYFCVSSDANGKDIIFNDNFDTNSIITISDGQYLELSRCNAIPFIEMPQDLFSDDTVLMEGMYKVGYHFPAGEYKLTAAREDIDGYYCIYPDSKHKKIISNDNFSGSRYVKVADGQYIVLNRCSLTLK